MLIARASIGRGFMDFLEQQENTRAEALITELSDWYGDQGSWDELAGNSRQFYSMVFTAFAQPMPDWQATERGDAARDALQASPGQSPPGGGPARQRRGRGGPGGGGSEAGREPEWTFARWASA